MSHANKLIIISGPTASGKTKTSIDLAEKIMNQLKIPTAIVNFDSLLFYKELSIGTAKPTLDEQKGIPHFMIDIESICSPMNASDFIKICENKITELLNKNICVILVGGSAFYLRALLKGMYESTSPSKEIKNKYDQILKDKGIDAIVDYLQLHDPESLKNLHLNDHYRLSRAAIHFEMTGTKISEQKQNLDDLFPYDFNEIVHPWKFIHFYLDLPKDEHFKIITSRTEKMFADGLMSEIQKLQDDGFSLDEKPLSSIGYKEAIELRNGQFPSEEACIERISISTRQLAKSQRTFFKRIIPKYDCNPLKDQDKIFSLVELFLR